MPRILLAVSFALLLLMTGVWTRAAQQPGAADLEAARFTGKTTVLEAAGVGATRRRFEPGARTAWHSHPNGQLLFVQEGRLRMQKRGQAIKEMGPGESDFTGPNVEHWHGAAAATSLTHVAVGFGGDTKWLNKVTDDEYAGKSRR
jgi:quercetin dioxygenase-like cupin family protein